MIDLIQADVPFSILPEISQCNDKFNETTTEGGMLF